MEMQVMVQRITPVPWRARTFSCKIGRHAYGDISDEDIACSSRYCKRCGWIDRFTGAALIECIRTRPTPMHREYAPHG